MPDIKTALTNAIQEKQMQNTAPTQTPDEVLKTVREWAADDMRARIPREPRYTGYLSRDIFLYVHANPGKTYREVEKAMALLPYKYNVSSCGTLLSQMRKCGMMTRDEEGKYIAAVDKYAPVDKSKTRTTTRTYALKKRPKKPAKAEVRGKISREKTSTPAPVVPVAPAPVQATPKPTDLDKLLSELSFPQAIELYKKLRAILGTATNVPLL